MQDLGTYTIEVPLQDAPKKVKALSALQWIMIKNSGVWSVSFSISPSQLDRLEVASKVS